jgi:hypothetical protein
MKRRKNYLHTNFIKFLIESESKDIDDEVKADEVIDDENIDDEVKADEVIDDENIDDEVKADEVIERLLTKLKKVSDEYDDIVCGRKRK